MYQVKKAWWCRSIFLPGILLFMIRLLAGGSLDVHARTVEVTLVHTTDLHGHVRPTISYEGKEDLGGFLRCASRIEDIRKSRPGVLLVDCGDTFQGSPESYLTRGRMVIEGLNLLRYDAWVLGNHEFDWGCDALRALHDQVQVPFLAANLNFSASSTNWLPAIRPYVIREIEGVRVAIVGLVTPGVPRWSLPHLLNGAEFMDSVRTLETVLPQVKMDRPDIIVVAAHQGFKYRGDDFANQVQEIARRFPEIDVMLGGHTHVPVADMRFNDVLYSQAGYHGIWLGIVELEFDIGSRRIVQKSARLELMDASVPFHDGLLSAYEEYLADADRSLLGIVCHLDDMLSPVPDEQGRSSMQQFIAGAIAAGTGADLVLHGSLDENGLGPGVVRYRDVWSIVPYENTIGMLALTPDEIVQILLENYAHPLTPYTMGPWGFSFDVDRNGGGMVIANLCDPGGVPLDPERRYKVAFNSFVLASGGGRYPHVRALAGRPEAGMVMLPVDTRELVVRHLKRGQQGDLSGNEVYRNVADGEVVYAAP